MVREDLEIKSVHSFPAPDTSVIDSKDVEMEQIHVTDIVFLDNLLSMFLFGFL